MSFLREIFKNLELNELNNPQVIFPVWRNIHSCFTNIDLNFQKAPTFWGENEKMQQCANCTLQLSQGLSSTFVLHISSTFVLHRFIQYCGIKEVELLKTYLYLTFHSSTLVFFW